VIDILVPTARIIDLVVCDEQVPYDLKGDVSGVMRGMEQVSEFAHAIGRAEKPKKPLMVYGPDNYMPIAIIGDGVTEAAEMQDLALEAIDRQQESVRKYGRGMDFDAARERAGMVRREDFGTAFAEAMAQRVKYLKANSRTDPEGRYANG